MRSRFALGSTLAVLVALVAGACSGSPTVTPPVVVNTAPTIESLVTASPRAEADVPIQVTAVVKDTDSTLDKLTYTWSASPQPGTFGGTPSFIGNQVINTWRPRKGEKSPDPYTITLTVSESYTSAGQARQNIVSAATTVHYNDSLKEMTDLAYDFLVYKFGNFDIGPAEAVSNFSDSCPGKAAEFDDVKDNRLEVHILSAAFTAPVASFDPTMTDGTVEGPCRFEDIPNSGPSAGRREFVSGICLLTTVYESANFRWRLCDSYFNGPYNTELASLRNRVPGRPYVR